MARVCRAKRPFATPPPASFITFTFSEALYATLASKPSIFRETRKKRSSAIVHTISPAFIVAICLIFNAMKILLISCSTWVLPSGCIGMFLSETEAIISTSSDSLPEICRLREELSTKSWLLPTVTPREIPPLVYNSLLFSTSRIEVAGYSTS